MPLIAEHADYRIFSHPADKAESPTIGPLVVTFGGQPSGIADSGFGTELCLSQGWDTVHVAQRHGTQYQGLPIEAFFEAISPIVQNRDVVCYGASLGAYAALYYGGCVNARIIAAAPMLPAWRPLRSRAYADLPLYHVELDQTPLSAQNPVVIYDPLLDRDKFVVDAMVRPAYPNTRFVEVPHGGHTVLVTLSRARLIKPLITALIERDEIISFTPPAEGTATWHAERGRSLMRSDLEAAIVELETSLALQPATQPFCNMISALIRKGDMKVVQDRLDAAHASGEPRLKIVPSLREKLQAMGLRLPHAAGRQQ